MTDLGEKIATWARAEDSILAVALIGSRARRADDDVWRPDAQSDWDFHIIAARPELFFDARWTKSLGLDVRAYALRRAALGGVPKVAAVFGGGEADFVIMPAKLLEPLRDAVSAGQHRTSPELTRTLQDLAIVARPGWRFLKGGETWDPFYRQVVAEVADPRLGDDEIRELAEGFVCDAVWVRRKIDRGELIAAQRMIHRALAEANFRLLHELKLRRGVRTFPEARRLERIAEPTEVSAVTVDATASALSLLAELEKCSETFRELVRGLVGESWRWPNLDL